MERIDAKDNWILVADTDKYSIHHCFSNKRDRDEVLDSIANILIRSAFSRIHIGQQADQD